MDTKRYMRTKDIPGANADYLRNKYSNKVDPSTGQQYTPMFKLPNQEGRTDRKPSPTIEHPSISPDRTKSSSNILARQYIFNSDEKPRKDLERSKMVIKE